MKTTTLLEVKGLSLKIDKETVVKSIDFEVPQNQITALVGASGSGKSLTALSLMNIQPKVVQIQCEKLLFDGDNLLLKTPKEWESIRGNT
ncbi:MAG: ATP-binding cassette domain-containing protein, partial [Flavobacteriaceae bacterium]